MTLSIDERLNKLELTLGLSSSVTRTDSSVSTTPIHSRVQSLVESADKLLPQGFPHKSQTQQQQQQSNLSNNLSEIERLGRMLEPTGGILASAVSSSNSIQDYPYIYRRQEILAQHDQLRHTLEQLSSIRQWISVSNPHLTKEIQRWSSMEGKQISMAHIVNSPIFNNAGFQFASNSNNQVRLETASKRIISLNEKALELMDHCDLLIEGYYTIIKAVNEKLLLLQDSV